jgi:ferric-dicitrate binding protein FerR (iron transport regulator)
VTEPRNGDETGASDAAIDRALADALRTEPLDEAAFDRVRAVVMDEWREAVVAASTPPRRRSLGRWAAFAAAAALALLALGLILRPTGGTAVVGTLVRLDGGRIDAGSQFWRHRTIRLGDPVRTGDTLTIHGPALLSLTRGGTLRVAADSVIDLADATEISLERGLVYVDMPVSSKPFLPFRVRTRVGTVEHLGTQFEVLSSEASVRIRVREGRVRLVGPAGAVTAAAGIEVVASLRGGISQRSIETYGRDWLWVTALAPDYEIEGRPLADFLQWASRELGRHIEYADSRARELAAHTILHGSVTGQEPLQALTDVLTSTSLTFDLRGDAIRVHSGS